MLGDSCDAQNGSRDDSETSARANEGTIDLGSGGRAWNRTRLEWRAIGKKASDRETEIVEISIRNSATDENIARDRGADCTA